ncbi:hypothetical protein Lesp02_10560 [Lentzea sp. NBRC 105346]|uniref:hypothetical protein n=1 Tax=Lentzea sp. NBRC 105346 TaxID=3032205 RepID=UPI0024A2F163|nr:hypothetical protein [Lentzea sp. NBRC 105346]GLZ28866.1 hypothetical protein Lesp02_10560 [Lentzea sp. NBRC 105346]
MNLAHGVGERHGLPLPLDLVLQAAAIALLVSFLGLGLLWKRPRFTETVDDEGRDRWPVRLIVLIGLLLVPAHHWPHLVFVALWVGVAVLSMLLGPVWRVLNPLRLAARFSFNRAYPERLGHWPAAVTLLAFAWVEHVEPHALPWFLLGYVIVNVAGGVVYGPTWFARADGFEVYSTLLGRLSPMHGNPFRRLMSTPVRPGLVAVIAVQLGATAFDAIGGGGTAGLLLAVVIVAGSYLLCTQLLGGPLAHSLIPIVAGYVVAHYYSLLVVEGQRMFGVHHPDETLVAPGTVAAVQIVAVLTGHVLAVIAAHDRTIALLPKQRHLTGQVPLLLLMVGYTAGGLALLFAG